MDVFSFFQKFLFLSLFHWFFLLSVSFIIPPFHFLHLFFFLSFYCHFYKILFLSFFLSFFNHFHPVSFYSIFEFQTFSFFLRHTFLGVSFLFFFIFLFLFIIVFVLSLLFLYFYCFPFFSLCCSFFAAFFTH